MANFIYDNTTLPGTKVDAHAPVAPGNQTLLASEFNQVTDAGLDIRGALTASRFFGFQENSTASLSIASFGRLRMSGSKLEFSANGGVYNVVAVASGTLDSPLWTNSSAVNNGAATVGDDLHVSGALLVGAQAANRLVLSGAAAFGRPSIAVSGSDTSISIDLLPKGTGSIRVPDDVVIHNSSNTVRVEWDTSVPALRLIDSTILYVEGITVAVGTLKARSTVTNDTAAVRLIGGDGTNSPTSVAVAVESPIALSEETAKLLRFVNGGEQGYVDNSGSYFSVGGRFVAKTGSVVLSASAGQSLSLKQGSSERILVDAANIYLQGGTDAVVIDPASRCVIRAPLSHDGGGVPIRVQDPDGLRVEYDGTVTSPRVAVSGALIGGIAQVVATASVDDVHMRIAAKGTGSLFLTGSIRAVSQFSDAAGVVAHAFDNSNALAAWNARLARFGSANVEVLGLDRRGKLVYPDALDKSNVPGNATINAPAGIAAVANSATAVRITCDVCTTGSIVLVTPLDFPTASAGTVIAYRAFAQSGSFDVSGSSAFNSGPWRFGFAVVN